MDNICYNHQEKKALSFCQTCKKYYCDDCLVEIGEYYYCKNKSCQVEVIKEKNNTNPNTKLSKKSGFKILKDLSTIYLAMFIVWFIFGDNPRKNMEYLYQNEFQYKLGASFGFATIPLLLSLIYLLILKIYYKNCKKDFNYRFFTKSAVIINIVFLIFFLIFLVFANRIKI